MRFSIILPIYNVEKYLQECMDSILSQTFQDYEVILVDDGSWDGSPALCDALAAHHPCIRVIHKPNGGAADSRNVGLKAAQGEYVIFIDSDDYILSNDFLISVHSVISQDTDQVLFKYCKYFDDTKRLAQCTFTYQHAAKETDYASTIATMVKDDAFFGMAWIRAIRRSLLLQHGISFETGLTGEDMDWNYKLMIASRKIVFLDIPYIAYRQHVGSVTSSYKMKNLTDYVYIVQKWAGEIGRVENKALREALWGSLAKNYSNLLIVYSRVRDREKLKTKQQIRELSWILKYGVSKRPQMIRKVCKLLGFNGMMLMLKVLDTIKG